MKGRKGLFCLLDTLISLYFDMVLTLVLSDQEITETTLSGLGNFSDLGIFMFCTCERHEVIEIYTFLYGLTIQSVPITKNAILELFF